MGDVNNISPNLNLPDGLTLARVNRRLRAVQALNVSFGSRVDDGNVARMFLAPRRMLEHGARFVEIRIGGWDTHADNFNQVAALAAPLDAALAAFRTDLAQRGLFEQTLVAMFGEFGRTPKINGDNRPRPLERCV